MNVLRRIGKWLGQLLRRQPRSLRGRLFLTLLGLAAVLLALDISQHAALLEQRRQLTQHGHRLAAQASATTIQIRLEDVFRTQKMLVRGVGRAQSVPAYLEDVRTEYPGLRWLQFQVKGREPIQAATADYPAYDRPDLFQLASASPGGRYVSNIEATPTSPPRFIIRVLSVTREQNPAGPLEVLVAMEFDVAQFPRLFEMKNPTAGELLLDRNGSGIYTFGAVPSPQRAMAEPEISEAVSTSRPSALNVPLGEEVELDGYAQPIEGTPWTLLYLEAETPIGGVGREYLPLSLLPFLIVLVLGIALWLVLRISIRPLVRLTAATRTLGPGELTVRLEKPEVEEFEGLVSAFNAMAERLERSQLALVEANARLEEEKSALDERVRAATRELQEEHDRLLRAERLSTLGLLSSSIAHDLRNPLNTVSLTVEWLRLRLADHSDERVRVRVETIRRELRRSDQIIRTLLGFARTGSPELAPTDLNQLVREVAEVVEPPESVHLKLELDPALPPVPADRAQLFQVLENLVRNAMQAMPDGGEIRLSSRANCDSCHLVVADTGPGVPQEVQEHIFEPLVSSKSAGTGLGLALAKRIVEAHHGHISLESRPGAGARFQIDLPISQDEPDS